MITKRLLLALSLTVLAASCQFQPVTQPPARPSPVGASAKPSPSSTMSPNSSESLSAFVMKIQGRFTIQGDFATRANDATRGDFVTQAVSEEHQALIEKAVTAFLADMEAGDVDAYFEVPEFAIKLLAGSEGSYFTGTDVLASLSSKAASYAMALVVDSEGYSAIFKGQFAKDSFFFDGADSLPPENTAYLITLDSELKATVTSGSLTPFTIQAVSASPSPSASATPLPSPSALDLGDSTATPAPPPPQRFEDALTAQQRRGPAYGLVAGRFMPAPPPPPPTQRPDYFVPPENPSLWPSAAIWEDIKRDHPEVAAAYRSLRGLLPAEHRRRLQELYAANQAIFKSPPPEGPVKPPEEDQPPPQGQGQPPQGQAQGQPQGQMPGPPPGQMPGQPPSDGRPPRGAGQPAPQEVLP